MLNNILFATCLVFTLVACGKEESNVSISTPHVSAVPSSAKLPEQPTVVQAPAPATKTAAEIKADEEAAELEKRQEAFETAALVNGTDAVRELKPAYCGFIIRDEVGDYWDSEMKVSAGSTYNSATAVPVFEDKAKGVHKVLVAGEAHGTFYWVYFRKGDITRRAEDTEAYREWKESDYGMSDRQRHELEFESEVEVLCKPVTLDPPAAPEKPSDNRDPSGPSSNAG